MNVQICEYVKTRYIRIYIHIFVSLFIYSYIPHINMNKYTSENLYIRVHAIHTRACTHVSIHTYTHVHMCLYTHIRMYACVSYRSQTRTYAALSVLPVFTTCLYYLSVLPVCATCLLPITNKDIRSIKKASCACFTTPNSTLPARYCGATCVCVCVCVCVCE